MKAVVWTDALQAVVFFAGLIIVLVGVSNKFRTKSARKVCRETPAQSWKFVNSRNRIVYVCLCFSVNCKLTLLSVVNA